MSAGSSMLAMNLRVPPQRTQRSISIPNTLQAPCPAHRHVPRRRRSPRIRGRRLRSPHVPVCRLHRRAQCAARGEHAVEARLMHARRRNQRSQARHQIQRFQHDVRRAIEVGRLQRVAHVAGCRQRQALTGHRRATDVTAASITCRLRRSFVLSTTPQERQNLRFLQLNATSLSAWHYSQRTRRKSSSSRPHFRQASNSS